MDEVEKAVRMGADAESMVARELKEPRCVAGGCAAIVMSGAHSKEAASAEYHKKSGH
jgi:hypothetical protein